MRAYRISLRKIHECSSQTNKFEELRIEHFGDYKNYEFWRLKNFGEVQRNVCWQCVLADPRIGRELFPAPELFNSFLFLSRGSFTCNFRSVGQSGDRVQSRSEISLSDKFEEISSLKNFGEVQRNVC